jgi:hypothetical protein
LSFLVIVQMQNYKSLIEFLLWKYSIFQLCISSNQGQKNYQSLGSATGNQIKITKTKTSDAIFELQAELFCVKTIYCIQCDFV